MAEKISAADVAPVPKGLVEAVGTATANKTASAAEIELAMADAVKKAMADGITDPKETQQRMLAAREAVLAKYAKAGTPDEG